MPDKDMMEVTLKLPNGSTVTVFAFAIWFDSPKQMTLELVSPLPTHPTPTLEDQRWAERASLN